MRKFSMSSEESVLWLKAQPEKAELCRACFFDDPLVEAAERYYQSSEWMAVRVFLPKKPGKVLDLGAGRGISSYALSKDGWDITALEPDKSNIIGSGAIRLLNKEAGLNIRIHEAWGEKLPFENETFDCVHARQVLHHAKDLKKLCLEVGRILKKGGIFIATREHVISKSADLPRFLENHPLHHLNGCENAFLLDEYISAIQNAGIKLNYLLNPYQSDINLFPDTIINFKTRLAMDWRFPWPLHIPDIERPLHIPDMVLIFLGLYNDVPGRLYTFIGQKLSANYNGEIVKE